MSHGIMGCVLPLYFLSVRFCIVSLGELNDNTGIVENELSQGVSWLTNAKLKR